MPAVQQILHKGKQASEVKTWIDVVFDHVKREIVRAAETPHDKAEKDGRLQREIFREQQCAGNQANHDEKSGFEVDRSFAFQVCHARLDNLERALFYWRSNSPLLMRLN